VDAFAAFEAAGWERRAAGYGTLIARITDRVAGRLVDSLGAGRVLDAGCGHGHAAGLLAARAAAVAGVDVSPAMIGIAAAAHPSLPFVVASADRLPFRARSFDAVFANFLLPHLGGPERAVAEFRRVAEPTGRLVLTTWDLPIRTRLVGVLMDALAEAGAPARPDLPDGPPFFRYAVRDGRMMIPVSVRVITA
jgi:ubiquinone/menaquinone biosynthesis C-methylase UbiE